MQEAGAIFDGLFAVLDKQNPKATRRSAGKQQLFKKIKRANVETAIDAEKRD